jgi:N-methylhydantoinase B
MPWSPAGIMRAIDVRTREGTVVHAAWPAGVSKATTTGSFMATIASGVCLSRLLAASDQHREQFMATWMGGLYVEDVFGVDQRGDYFGAAFLDAMAGGSGARAHADGIDTGGFLDSPSSIIANVEDYEYSYPVLYLYRRQQRDTGGAGKFRGGATISMMYVPHDVEVIPTKIMHAIGTLQPGSVGIYGGYPSCTNQFVIKRGTNIRALLAAGQVPQELDAIAGDLEIFPDSIAKTSQGRDDVYRCVAMGGGGYGDPLERDPERVLRDVINGIVSVEHAAERYGVVIDPDGPAVDAAATEQRRAAIRDERRATATMPERRG